MRSKLVLVALFLACALVIVLGHQNRQLVTHQAETYAKNLQPQIGTWLPSLGTADIYGAPVQLGRSQRAQVIYFFRPDCKFCEESAPIVRWLSTAIGPENSIVGVGGSSNEDLIAYASSKGFDFPIIRQTPKIRSLYNVRQVPLLVVVNADGQILYSHLGAIKNKDEMAQLMTTLRNQGSGPPSTSNEEAT